MDKDHNPQKEQRKFIRLDSVLPVQFRLLTLDGQGILSDWQQGFTNNICRSGIALTVNNLNPDLAEMIKQKKAKLSLDLEIPLTRRIVNAKASIVWIQAQESGQNKYLMGLLYEAVNSDYNNMIMRYVFAKKYAPRILIGLLIVLTGLILISGYFNNKLIKNNKDLVEQLVGIIQDSSVARQKIKDIAQEKEDLELKIQTLQSRIQAIEDEKPQKEIAQDEQIKQLNAKVFALNQEKSFLQQQLIALQNKESKISEEILDLDKRKSGLEKANLDKMYRWLAVHQNPRTGLVVSFEGDNELVNQAFTYDQALVAQTFTELGNFMCAKKILAFFQKKAKRIDGQFLNAYYCQDGSPSEYTVRAGPNIWLGIAIMQYTHESKDYSFLDLAKEIASTIIYFQKQDEDGGIRGGPDVDWYSTEHNLDAYAFFNMLHKITGEQSYRQAQDKILNWLKLHTYDKSDVPVKRGKGDSTIATDTYAWSVAALGPEKLQELGMDPDKILEFAEENCSAEVSFARPEGKAIKIKGFDFAPQRHLARGGVVSSEWTAQMILAFNVMEEFYYNKGLQVKARAYDRKIEEYLSQLGNMVISSPSPSGQGEGCLPYATQDYVDTGHGWMTPKGKSTCSAAGTAYALFAYYKYNPLKLQE
jgi:cell division protein FtsB